MPWPAKILAKLVMSRLPVSYDAWRRTRLFRDGAMDNAAYAVEVAERHMAGIDLTGRVVLELGVGDSVATGLIAHARGARRVHLIDDADHVVRDVARYRPLLDRLEASGYLVAHLREAVDFRDLLRRAETHYGTGGLEALRAVPDASVDLVFSNAVLEHVRLREFDAVLGELRRIAAPGSVASHEVDLRDHLSDALNNLRFPETTWESDWMSGSGFYTNRIRYRDMVARFEAAGFLVEVLETRQWEGLPTPRARMHSAFRRLAEEDLRVQSFRARLEPR